MAAYEAERGVDVVGGYAPAPLDQGHASVGPAPGRTVTLLGCGCGEVGCWPLDARVRRTGDRSAAHAAARVRSHRPRERSRRAVAAHSTPVTRGVHRLSAEGAP
ncbi:hypothetical protein GCM10011381_04310 [Klenkia taihuensis]|nr:hypothetical protein GCM10011381_04310 [Klenkia taihuensis]